jgi:agmatine deiminase
VITITAPRPRRLDDGRQQALSYLNFYLANDAVIMPYFDDPMDDAAFRRVARALSARTMVEIDASALVKGGGGIHCITQQQPSAARAAGA